MLNISIIYYKQSKNNFSIFFSCCCLNGCFNFILHEIVPIYYVFNIMKWYKIFRIRYNRFINIFNQTTQMSGIVRKQLNLMLLPNFSPNIINKGVTANFAFATLIDLPVLDSMYCGCR